MSQTPQDPDATPPGDAAAPPVPDAADLDRALGAKRQAVMNGPQYTQREKGRTWEHDVPAPQDP
ncbi:MAG TPA: hypothetical protein VFW71_10575 [Actinomycetota bacterium]|nr:hypothetical protein [Actinomycetota bacterium]